MRTTEGGRKGPEACNGRGGMRAVTPRVVGCTERHVQFSIHSTCPGKPFLTPHPTPTLNGAGFLVTGSLLPAGPWTSL